MSHFVNHDWKIRLVNVLTGYMCEVNVVNSASVRVMLNVLAREYQFGDVALLPGEDVSDTIRFEVNGDQRLTHWLNGEIVRKYSKSAIQYTAAETNLIRLEIGG